MLQCQVFLIWRFVLFCFVVLNVILVSCSRDVVSLHTVAFQVTRFFASSSETSWMREKPTLMFYLYSSVLINLIVSFPPPPISSPYKISFGKRLSPILVHAPKQLHKLDCDREKKRIIDSIFMNISDTGMISMFSCLLRLSVWVPRSTTSFAHLNI